MKIFQDLDGCLADFERGVHELTGKEVHELNIGKMWGAVARADEFFYNLPWMKDGQELWNGVQHLDPTILTGIPHGGWASGQKKKWCGKELGWHVPVITCWSKEKHLYGQEGDVLIDDRIMAKAKWEDMGGIFIHHTSAVDTLKQLAAL